LQTLAPPIVVALVLGGTTPAAALDLTAGSGAAAACQQGIPSLQAAAVAYTEPAPVVTIGDYGGGRYAPAAANNIAVGTGFAEASVAVSDFCVGLLGRAELFGTASRDVLDVVVGNHFNRPFDVGREYQLRYNLEILQAAGARVRRVFTLDPFAGVHLKFGVGLSLLDALQGRVESLQGSAVATSPNYAVGTATWLRTDSDLNPNQFNPFVGAGHPHGAGYSTDVQIQATTDFGTTLDLIVMDVVGRIYWRDDRTSLRVANDVEIRYDADFNRDALINGVDTRGNYVQNIRTKYRGVAAQSIADEFSVVVADDCVGGYHFPSVGARIGGGSRFGTTSFDIRSHALSIGGAWSVLSIDVTSNRFDIRQATALGASVGLHLRW
jgi:hypothetical protein